MVFHIAVHRQDIFAFEVKNISRLRGWDIDKSRDNNDIFSMAFVLKKELLSKLKKKKCGRSQYA